MPVQTGLDHLVEANFQQISGRKVALVCNQASIDGNMNHAADLFKRAAGSGRFTLKCFFGPQHGLWGHTQDNMIEWQGSEDPCSGAPIHSLYGEHRKPTAEMLADVDTLVIDLQDVGAKYYTFIWTMALCMEAAGELGIEVLVLDRPNPVNGIATEGTAANQGFLSFVGLRPFAARHGMTIGEVATYFKQHFYPDCALQVLRMSGWHRQDYFESTGLPWAMPSPNIPCNESAVVYPGMCLLEATMLSEGRGTTRPFELFGAPFIDGWRLAERLNGRDLPGIHFRPLEFQPTFQKYAGEVCGGCFMHVTNRDHFLPFYTTIVMLADIMEMYPDDFQWKQPPYEYEYEKMPFDILVGNDWLRTGLEAGTKPEALQERWRQELAAFSEGRTAALLY